MGAGVTVPPWFDPKWREIYARALAEIVELEAMAKDAGRRIRPQQEKDSDGTICDIKSYRTWSHPSVRIDAHLAREQP